MYVRGYLQGSENGRVVTIVFYFWLPHCYWLPILLLVTPLLLVTSFTSDYPFGILKLFIYSFNKLNAFTYFFYHNCSVLLLFIFWLFYFYIQASILISINNITGFFFIVSSYLYCLCQFNYQEGGPINRLYTATFLCLSQTKA